ncbi:MAG: VRR-NUC domain-containing protein, partial [Betaproteobacteria bacterium]|nr:VRR-NUC domain-containing protein [Betaproteobacteria bacterium]
KVPGEEPTRVQYHRMRQLAEAGAAVTWVTSAGEAKGFLEGIES